MHLPLQRTFGLLIWLTILAAAALGPLRETIQLASDASVIHPWMTNASDVQTEDPDQILVPHTPVFVKQKNEWKQSGLVLESSDPEGTKSLIRWYGDEAIASEYDFVAYRSSGQLSEVVSTLLPEEKRKQITNRLNNTFQLYGQEFVDDLIPLIQQTLNQAVPQIEKGFRESIARNEREIDEMLNRWNTQYFEPELIPLAKEELLPIVRLHAQPVAESIGRELWDRASLWRFGWRAAYDKVPLPKRNLVQQEWDRFVEDDALPVFESHTDEMVTAIQRTLSDITTSQTIRDQVGDGITRLAKDKETRNLIQKLIRESIIENEALRVALSDVWSSDRAEEWFEKNSRRLEPVIRQIGEDLFGSETEGINPDFARVLRNQILGKDRNWVIALPRETESLPRVRRSKESMPYPVIYTTSDRRLGGKS